MHKIILTRRGGIICWFSLKIIAVALIFFASLARTTQAFDLEGSWHVSGLGTPGNIFQNRDAQGVVIGINGNNTFDAASGALPINSAGVISGSVGGTVSGNASVTPEGVVTFSLTSPEIMTLTFQITSTSDLMTGANGDSEYHELLILAKVPSDAAVANAAGTWWVVEFEAPAAIQLVYNTHGKVIGVNGGTSFRKARSPLVITGARYIYNSGEEMVDIAVTAKGTMSITPDNPLVPGIQFHMNTRKDVMIGNVPESSTRSLIVLVKTHQVNNWEAAGHWALNAANLPSSLTLQYKGTGLVTNINGLNSFGRDNGWVDFTLQGTLAGKLGDAFVGFSSGSSDGLFSINHGEGVFVVAANVSGDFFVGVDGGGVDSSIQMITGVRSIHPFSVAALPGSSPKIVWVPGPGRVLQEASDLSHWNIIPATATTSCYLPNPATDGSHHFYQLVTPFHPHHLDNRTRRCIFFRAPLGLQCIKHRNLRYALPLIFYSMHIKFKGNFLKNKPRTYGHYARCRERLNPSSSAVPAAALVSLRMFLSSMSYAESMSSIVF